MPKKTYPRTESRTWVWPRSQYMRNTLIANSTPMVCPYNDVVSSAPLTFVDTVFYGDNAAGWRERIRLGNSATTVLQGMKAVVRMPVGTASFYNSSPTVYCQNGAGWGNYTGYLLSLYDPGPAANATADAKAKAKLLNSYMDAVNTWRGGNFMAEIKETLHFITHPVKAFYHKSWEFAGHVRKLGRVYEKHPVDYLKALSDAWLAYRFGVNPLIQDANDAFLALARLGEGGRADVFNKLRGSSRFETVSVDEQTMTPNGWVGSSYKSTRTVKGSFKVRYIGSIKTMVDESQLQAVEFGVTFDDIAPAIWEATWLSFLVDYFTNVQEVLDGLRWISAAPSRLDLNVRNVGVVQIGPLTSTNSAPTIVTSISCGAAHSMVVRVSRAPINDFPMIGFRFKLPGFPSLKWLNIAALTKQFTSAKPAKGLVDLPYFRSR